MTDYIIGIAIGIVVAIVLSMLLHLTVFKDKNMTFLYFLMVIVFACVGGVVQAKYTYHNNISGAPDPREQFENLVTDVTTNWGNTNGGFTIEEIETTQKDIDAPLADDQIVDLRVTDFGGYVTFSYKNGEYVENILFYKSKNGLVVDGVMNTHSEMDNLFFKRETETFRWVYEDKDKLDMRYYEPYYYSHNPFWYIVYDDLVSLSRQSNKFDRNRIFDISKYREYDLKQAEKLTADNLHEHWEKFGDVEIIGTKENAFVKVNSFYNYLYQQLKTKEYNTVNIIDCTGKLCLPIPKAEQANYPIPESKRAEYSDKENYGVYKCAIAVNATWVEGNKRIDATTNNDDYIERIEGDEELKEEITVEDYEVEYYYTKVRLGFNAKTASRLTDEVLLANPITITFTGGSEIKSVVIDSMSDLNSGLDILLESDKNYTYSIDSKVVLFDSPNGMFSVGKEYSKISFDYSYLDGCVVAMVGLNPIGSIDKTKLDLKSNPVKIVLTNDKHSYEFTFSDNAMFNARLPMLVELGTYSYSILSNQLTFASNSGSLEIASTSGAILFNCALSLDKTIGIRYSSEGSSWTCAEQCDLVIGFAKDIFTNAVKMFNDSKCDNITIVLYDKDSNIVVKKEFSFSNDITSDYVFYSFDYDLDKFNALQANLDYYAQIIFNSTDCTISSNVCKFTFYKSSKTVAFDFEPYIEKSTPIQQD